jgi:hypothetical protein
VLDKAAKVATLARLVDLREVLSLAPQQPPPAPDLEAKRAEIAGRRKRLVEAVAAGKLGLDDIDAPLAELDAALGDVEAAAAEHAARAATDNVEERPRCSRSPIAVTVSRSIAPACSSLSIASPCWSTSRRVALLLVEALLPGARCRSWPSRPYLVLAEAELGAVDVETVREQGGGKVSASTRAGGGTSC